MGTAKVQQSQGETTSHQHRSGAAQTTGLSPLQGLDLHSRAPSLPHPANIWDMQECGKLQGGAGRWLARWRRMLRDGLLGWMRALQQPCSAPGAVPALLPRAGVPAPGAVPIACHQTRCQHARLSAEAEGTSCRKNILPGPAWSYLVLFSCTLVLFGPIRSFLVLLGPVRSYLVRLGPV